MKRPSFPLRQDGLTLAEIAAVTLLAGALTLSWFKGCELLTLMKMKKAVSRVQTFYAASMNFRDKYDCLPGDCIRAMRYFGTATLNGNGDRIINSNSSESPNFWRQLWLAHMIDERTDGQLGPVRPGHNAPSLSYDTQGAYVVRDLNLWGLYGNVFEFGLPDQHGLYAANGPTMTPVQASAIDYKIDDGVANTGDFLCMNGRLMTCSAPYAPDGVGANYKLDGATIASCSCVNFVKF